MEADVKTTYSKYLNMYVQISACSARFESVSGGGNLFKLRFQEFSLSIEGIAPLISLGRLVFNLTVFSSCGVLLSFAFVVTIAYITTEI